MKDRKSGNRGNVREHERIRKAEDEMRDNEENQEKKFGD